MVIKNIHSLDEINMVCILYTFGTRSRAWRCNLAMNQKLRPLVSLQDFSLDVILRQRWTDKRLEFEHNKITSLELDQKMIEKIWVPDSFFPQEKRAKIHTVTVPNRLLHIHKDGTVVYSMRLNKC